ncbi:unnamed protein product [Spirodela intermedia]|uniref:Reverse transcriptase RNase H-like domain-containing protein n=1 Tax=Spirodela intermedia TaxID=51605 RepID=A0A7I8K870_SPIIN|nr:unnamed protein product [Spirodela intermedia]
MERQYSVHEKDIIAIVHYLWMWCHYLLDRLFVVYTNNVATSCFLTQYKLMPKYAS